MKPLVSILVPAYNAEKWIAETIESALAQTWGNKEIIVVNDGSRDNTLAVVKKYESKFVKVIDQENKGHCVAKNRAFNASQGELIKFLDADDLINKENVELQVERLNGDFDSIASCEWGRFYGPDPQKAVFEPEKVWTDLKPVDWLVEALWEKAESMMQCGIFLIPRRILLNSGLWDERLSLIDDYEFFTRVLLKSNGIKFTPGAKLFYRSGINTSISNIKSRKGIESAFLSISLACGHLLKAEHSDRTKFVCANVWQHFIYDNYPNHKDLLVQAEEKIKELGGATLKPIGGPLFKYLSFLVGWKMAKRVQNSIYQIGYKKLASVWSRKKIECA